MEVRVPSASRLRKQSPFLRWLLEDDHSVDTDGPYAKKEEHKTHPWWKVMCLTGVDYFSTLGYQPGIAFIAAGALSPFATFVLILLTIFGAYPVYAKVSAESPNGQGSIAMLESLLNYWPRKLFVLALLGFAATDFIITITLSAADAGEHFLTNPLFREHLHVNEHMQIPATLILVLILAGVFLRGFKEAVGIAVALVGTYLALTAVVLVVSMNHLFHHANLLHDWQSRLFTVHGSSPLGIALFVMIIFPKLALGLSGFETGVAVMGLVKGDPSDTPDKPTGRIRNTRRLLLTAALIMSVFLMLSSIVTTMVIPEVLMKEKGEANTRALSWLAHQYLGEGFGTVFDISTILILWFAGASAMAGLLNIVPRYLPRYGMAPEWTKANRPLVLMFTAIAAIVTIVFKASVDAQGAAYATGVLFLMTSAAFAVAYFTRRKKKGWTRHLYWIVFVIFLYTFVQNVHEKPEGLKIAALFIGGIVLVSVISRVWRTLELRVDSVNLDIRAQRFVEAAAEGDHLVRLIPNRPEARDVAEYDRKTTEIRRDHDIPAGEEMLFVEIEIEDASDFSGEMRVTGHQVGPHLVLRVKSVAIPNAMAALMFQVRDLTDKRPHAYFSWGESSPFKHLGKMLLTGQGDIAPVAREIVRRIEPDPERRPVIHVAS
ncbi:amino acid transporter [bacterium]|nr:MAG: amino acid transporter [bacterium]